MGIQIELTTAQSRHRRGWGNEDRRLQGVDDIPALQYRFVLELPSNLRIKGARYPAAPLGLITVAALLPQSWEVRLVNRNTDTLAKADIEHPPFASRTFRDK